MPKKYPDETIYMKVDGKYVATGKLYDRDHIGYGNYFVYNGKYSRGLRWIGATPDPDFIGLETALEESREEIRLTFRKILEEYFSDGDRFRQDYYAVDAVIQAVRKTYIDKKKEMLNLIKQ